MNYHNSCIQLDNTPKNSTHLHFGCSCQEDIIWRFHGFTFLELGLLTNQQIEMGCQVSSQQSLIRWDVQQLCHGFYIETRFQNLCSKNEIARLNPNYILIFSKLSNCYQSSDLNF